MKHIKKQAKKINKESIKKAISMLVILFFAMVMLFQKDVWNTQLQFVWNADEVFMHNAANTQWDYLFEDEGGQETYQWQITTWTTNPTTGEEDMDSLINPDEVGQLMGETQTGTTWILSTGTLYTWALYTWNIQTGTQTATITWTVKTGSLDCITPRKEKVKNKDFVLAYQQRKDVNTICNIEKRVCMSGTLGWSFTQSSCKENVTYTYNKAEVISYNQKVLNEYIQPTAPVNSWADFNTEGKIDEPETKPIDTRTTPATSATTQAGTSQTPLSTPKNCTTPRGQTIKHGQFVKAYKAPRGFIDLPCDVELRACVQGKLKWTYTNAKCTYTNTTYSDYLTANSPTTNSGFLFFDRIKSIIKRGR